MKFPSWFQLLIDALRRLLYPPKGKVRWSTSDRYRLMLMAAVLPSLAGCLDSLRVKADVEYEAASEVPGEEMSEESSSSEDSSTDASEPGEGG